MSRFNIPGLLGAIGELPSVINRGLLGPLPVNPQLGLDPTQVQQAKGVALNDMAFGMLAAGGGPRNNPMGGLYLARQQARENFSGRMVEILREQEFARLKQEREDNQKKQDAYRATLDPRVQPIADVAGLPNVAQAEIASLMAPQDPAWRMLTPEEEAQIPGLDPSLMYKTNGRDIEVLGGRPPAPTIGSISLGQPNGLPDYLKERQKVVAGEISKYESEADAARAGVARLDTLIEQSRKTKLTGALAPGVMGAADFLRSFGINVAPEDMTDARALDSLINQNHMQWVADLGGARGMTDSENKKLAQALVKIQDSPQARVEVATLLRDAEKRRYEKARAGVKRKAAQLEDIAKGGMGISEYDDIPEAPPAGGYPRAENKATGETLIFKDGKWQPE